MTNMQRDKTVLCMAHGQGGAEVNEDCSPTLSCNHEAPIMAGSHWDNPENPHPTLFAIGTGVGMGNQEVFGQRGANLVQELPVLREAARIAGIDLEATGKNRTPELIAFRALVRRLTTVECARLQGFPDHHTAIPWRGKPAEQCPDGPQYKGYGNSMCVKVIEWIGKRIEAFLEGK